MTKIKIVNKFTNEVTIIEVANKDAWKALTHYRRAWNISSANFTA